MSVGCIVILTNFQLIITTLYSTNLISLKLEACIKDFYLGEQYNSRKNKYNTAKL